MIHHSRWQLLSLKNNKIPGVESIPVNFLPPAIAARNPRVQSPQVMVACNHYMQSPRVIATRNRCVQSLCAFAARTHRAQSPCAIGTRNRLMQLSRLITARIAVYNRLVQSPCTIAACKCPMHSPRAIAARIRHAQSPHTHSALNHRAQSPCRVSEQSPCADHGFPRAIATLGFHFCNYHMRSVHLQSPMGIFHTQCFLAALGFHSPVTTTKRSL